jgi:hypothetical protein
MMAIEMSTQIFKSNTSVRSMTTRKMTFPNGKERIKAQIKLDDGREENFFLIYEPSLRFKGNKSDTTCPQTLKCHHSTAQLTPPGQ